MNKIRNIQKLNQRELAEGISPNASWHTDYRDTAFIYIGGLPYELSEGDIITVFSQYGEPVWIKLARDKETGKSRGFAWLKYEDQRSCDLAVDNLAGATVLDRMITVDHARYKPRDDEDMRDNTMGERLIETLEEDDPMKESMVKSQQEKVDSALKRLRKAKRKERKEQDRERERERRHQRDRSRDRHRDRDRSPRRIKDEDGSSHHRSSRRDDSRDRDDNRRRRHRGRDPDREERDRERNRSSDRDRTKRRYSSGEDDRKREKRNSKSASPRRARA
ncbi:RNA-binding domain-containing protein [Corynespora cassiicola Philippines]|uniref:RNA-binding domain-containing protein n=1 Tax=Corynespora cassiicola Philippines TaxID=1448308 RepID=A0A2T2P4I4_CORCC|nr:RNA-binding domain-containing protein [Corynespora cassiicola Philippines]